MTVGSQIIALGGGGFSMEPRNLALDRYVLEQARGSTPRVLFVPTASGDADGYIARFYTAFTGLPCRPQHLPLFRTRGVLRDIVLAHDVVYVGGGNTKSMLAIWREWELPAIFREAWAAGVVLAGLSAGAICWFEEGVTDSIPGALAPLSGLGLLAGSCCPHYDGESQRRPGFARLLQEGRVRAGLALDDGAAAHFVDGVLHRVVSSRAKATAYRVERAPNGAGVTE